MSGSDTHIAIVRSGIVTEGHDCWLLQWFLVSIHLGIEYLKRRKSKGLLSAAFLLLSLTRVWSWNRTC